MRDIKGFLNVCSKLGWKNFIFIADNIGLKQPVGLERNVVTSRVFSVRKNLGKSCKDFLFKPCYVFRGL